MFNDERINKAVSNVYRKGIMYASLVTLVFVLLKLKLADFNFFAVIPELTVLIAGSIIVFVGFIKYGTPIDEREIELRNACYQKGAKLFLLFCIIGFAISAPISLTVTEANTYSANYLFLNLQLVGFIYVTYSFKKEKIQYNYTFLEVEEKYYNYVFKNLLKLLIAVVIIYAFTALFFIILLDSIFLSYLMLGLLLGFIYTYVSLGLLYFFISWIERWNYLELLKGKNRLVSQWVVGSFVLHGSVLMVVLRLFIVVATKDINTYGAELVANILILINDVGLYYSFFAAMLFTAILLLFRSRVRGLGMIIAASILNPIINTYNRMILNILFGHINDEAFRMLTIGITMVTALVFSLLTLVGWFMLAYYLSKKGVTGLVWVIPSLNIASTLISAIPNDNIMAIFAIGSIANLVSSVFVFIVFGGIKSNEIEEISDSVVENNKEFALN